MRFTESNGRQVVATSTAETVATVNGFVVDPASQRVVAIEVSQSKGGDLLRWGDLTAFGTDAVTVASTESLTDDAGDLDALRGKAHHLLGKRVLSADGNVLGEVADVDFDPETGRVAALVLDDAEIDGTRLVGVGSYAVVVRRA